MGWIIVIAIIVIVVWPEKKVKDKCDTCIHKNVKGVTPYVYISHHDSGIVEKYVSGGNKNETKRRVM